MHDDIKDLNDQEKFAWAARLATMEQQGQSEISAMNELNKTLERSNSLRHPLASNFERLQILISVGFDFESSELKPILLNTRRPRLLFHQLPNV